jgi:hypothetical protein
MKEFIKNIFISRSGISSKRILAFFLIVLPTIVASCLLLVPKFYIALDYMVAYITPCFSTATLLLGLTSFEKTIKESQKE